MKTAHFLKKDLATSHDDGVGAANDVWIKNYHLEYLIDKLGESS